MTDELSIRVERSFTAISPKSWSRLSGASKSCSTLAYNPFVSHAFLSSLEESGSADAETGWLGHHLLLETDRGELVGALPGYLKNHSQGEYVFDHGWADAFERAGGRYYPKLQCSIPFTPATGPRLLVAEGLQRLPIQSAIAESLKEVVRRLGIS
ncbi:MAG: peptidogalycan biosysnthesis protein, partial [Rhizobium sp.]|uniref:peptidogalycan biosysnthesis protein n=1 Tax=Rhizobium sp. TaxID=391 RepID=UPI00389A8AF4